VIAVDFYHRKYYLYDDKSNVISFLDSEKTDKGFKVSEYKFQYDEMGILTGMTGPNMKSTFNYNKNAYSLFETLTKNDTVYNNFFSYDTKGRLHDAIYRSADDKPTLRVTKNYGPNGKLYNDISVEKRDATVDSTLTIYEYNNSMQLYKKERFRFITQYVTLDKGGTKPDHTANHQDVGVTTYNLDENGRPVDEEFSIKGDKLSYHYSTWKYNEKGLLIRETFRIGHIEPRILEHEYVFFE
jgi:hypothetical protein